MRQQHHYQNCVVKRPSCHPVRGEKRGGRETRLDPASVSFFSPSFASRSHPFQNGVLSAQSPVPNCHCKQPGGQEKDSFFILLLEKLAKCKAAALGVEKGKAQHA